MTKKRGLYIDREKTRAKFRLSIMSAALRSNA